MTAPVEFTAPAADQTFLRGVLRTSLRLLFRGLVRPPMPITGQRAVLRLLTAASPALRGITRSTGLPPSARTSIPGRP